MNILITGDLVINREYSEFHISDSVKALFKQSDFNIVNLEAPVTLSKSEILKTGPHLKSHKESTLKVLQTLQVDVATLANNHILDYDEQGVKDTLEFCRENKIQSVGAGKEIVDASKTLYFDSSEGKIAIVNFAENEWSSATEKTAGANPMDIIDNVKQIKEAKQKADFVFVVVHGGHEYYNLPSPRMQKQYRFYAEQGADIVIGHHTHCISGYETYQGVPIYYSLGNFLFTKPSLHNDWYNGLILEITIQNGKLIPELHPVEQDKKSFKLYFPKESHKEKTLERILNYNEIIQDRAQLERSWISFVNSKYDDYLNYWSPLSFVNNRYINGVMRRLRIKMINKKGMALALNLIRCEAHNDMSKEVIQTYLKK